MTTVIQFFEGSNDFVLRVVILSALPMLDEYCIIEHTMNAYENILN